MATSEGELKRAFCDDAKKHNAIVFHIVANMRQEAGFPDTFISHIEWQGHIEFKRVDIGKVEPKQEWFIREINQRKPFTALFVWLGSVNSVQWFDGLYFRAIAFDGTWKGFVDVVRRVNV